MKKRALTVKAILCAAGVLLCTASALAETATIVSAASLRQHPDSDAPIVAQLVAGEQVQLNERAGGWKRVTTNNASAMSGWVRSYQVRSGELVVTEEPSSGGFLGGLANLSRKVSGLFSSDQDDDERKHGSAVATIGVRGLSEEEIKNASPDFREMEKMESFRVGNKAAKNFARKGQRKSVKLAHLPRSAVEE